MAVIVPTITERAGRHDGSIILVTWVLTTADVAGTAVSFPEWADRTWQVGLASDTFGGATCTIQGSNTNVDGDFVTLSNAAGATAATFAAAGVKAIIELPLFVRPKLTTAGAGATVTAILLMRRAQPLRV